MSLQSRRSQHHNSDNNNNIVANTTLLVDVSSTNSEEEIKDPKLVLCSDSQGLEDLKEKSKQVVGIVEEAKVNIKKELNVDVLSKPNVSTLDQSSKIIHSTEVKTLLLGMTKLVN